MAGPMPNWIAVSAYVLVAIIRKRLKLDVPLYTLMQVFSLTVFETASIEYIDFPRPTVLILSWKIAD
jgi:hypothetical protein